MPALTPEVTHAFWEGMCAHYNTRVIDKERAPEMHASGHVLAALGIMSYQTVMTRYTTVWGRRIYPCFVVGEGDEDALWGQVVICTHEHQHVEQYRRDGFFRYTASYLLDSRARALYEAEAYGCNLELAWLKQRSMPATDMMAKKLLAYGCDDEDVAAARDHFDKLVLKIKDGSYRSAAVERALEFLPPDLLVR